MITAYPQSVRADSTGALLVLEGPPNRAVTWALIFGAGTLTPLSSATDANGRAAAKYVPNDAPGADVRITATYGA